MEQVSLLRALVLWHWYAQLTFTLLMSSWFMSAWFRLEFLSLVRDQQGWELQHVSINMDTRIGCSVIRYGYAHLFDRETDDFSLSTSDLLALLRCTVIMTTQPWTTASVAKPESHRTSVITYIKMWHNLSTNAALLLCTNSTWPCWPYSYHTMATLRRRHVLW